MLQKDETEIKEILSAIESADDIEINEIIQALIRRYRQVSPDWEVFFLSVPKEPEKRNVQLKLMLESLRSEKPD